MIPKLYMLNCILKKVINENACYIVLLINVIISFLKVNYHGGLERNETLNATHQAVMFKEICPLKK